MLDRDSEGDARPKSQHFATISGTFEFSNMCTPSFRQSAARHRRHTCNATTRNRISEAAAVAVVKMVVRTKLSNVDTLAFGQGFSARKCPRLDIVLALVPSPISCRTPRTLGAGGFALRKLHGGDTLLDGAF
jgi:hypothetical protein